MYGEDSQPLRRRAVLQCGNAFLRVQCLLWRSPKKSASSGKTCFSVCGKQENAGMTAHFKSNAQYGGKIRILAARCNLMYRLNKTYKANPAIF